MSRQKPATPQIRCAIYSRKSSDDGLDQEFNSLDAQRESGEAFIASQKNEGWICLPARYDDGGFSGGNMDRPGLARLLADIEAGHVDCVVVYKVDRLSRSLMDFARIMGTFESRNVSFVSVTQQFNTTHSMGRLTLNILLSFAQFEREIIGERIRDKIAAQRRKGKWAGGIPVLGYDVDRSNPSLKLVVNAAEATRVRDIDGRRAAVWRATYDQQIADPVIRASMVQFSREAGLAYWKWVAAGQKYKLGQQWLQLAEERNDSIKRRVALQDLDPPELTDNLRAIAKREAKLADSMRIYQQAAVKLSLFLRDDSGQPYFPTAGQLPEFPALRIPSMSQVNGDISRDQQSRPELNALDLQLLQLRVDYAEACNMTKPGWDAQLVGSQDVGEPTSKKRDKSEFELEAALFFDLPLQRRKGRGKMHAVQAKMSQLSAKRRMVRDKVAAEVQTVYAGLIQSRQEALKAREAVALASKMADIERRKFEVGDSDLLKVALREQYALVAAEEKISATFRHFAAFTEYAASLAIDRPTEDLLPSSQQ